MKKMRILIVWGLVYLGGCSGIRPAASEAQKQNAWAHWRTCDLTEQTAQQEAVSQTLQSLTSLTAQQSEAFVLDYGLPKEPPKMETVEAVLSGGGPLARQASDDALRQPDVWAMADGVMELGIGIAGLLGGVYGLRIATFLKQARQKSDALKEIIEGNELFKRLCPSAASDFKQAHANQSPATKRLVTETKG
ncbi:MAG: hypothetical protein GX298_10775 [Planctomycetes bacterium]|jgi:hypothetical protein|nr:hypothetical protein [Planctomycetota bacterium]